MRHDSQPLALLALGAAFLNPFTTDALAGPAVLAYVVVVSAGALVLSTRMNWRVLERAAFVGSWVTAFASGQDAVPMQLAWGSVLFLLFAGQRFLPGGQRRLTDEADALQAVANGFLFLLFVETALGSPLSYARGTAAFGIAAVYVLLWAVSRVAAPGDAILARTFQGLAVAMTTIGLVFQFHGLTLGTVWSVEGVLLLWLGLRTRGLDFGVAGVTLVGLGFLRTIVVGLELGAYYLPSRLLLSPESLAVAVQVAALASTAWLLRGETRNVWARHARDAAAAAANVVTLGWASAEARAAFLRHDGAHRPEQIAFAYSAIWASYAAVAYGVGIAIRSRRVRLAAAGLFALTVAKMVTNDVWLLGSALRTVVFVGVGVLLIACSLAYHRFREAILGKSR
jgi:uncharacterized membrane protein